MHVSQQHFCKETDSIWSVCMSLRPSLNPTVMCLSTYVRHWFDNRFPLPPGYLVQL